MKQTKVTVKAFALNRVIIPIVGIAPLIVHGWSVKSRQEMEDKQGGAASNRKHEPRDPQQEYEAAKHLSVEGLDGFPVGGVKGAIIRGAKIIGMVMKDTQTSFFVIPDCEETQLVRILATPRMRTDMVRVSNGQPDIRYRPEYINWRMNLTIEYNEGMLSLNQLHQLVMAAGYGVGLGEMRPEKTKFGFGRFKLADEK